MATAQGTYIGNDGTNRTIPLAFTPKFVILVVEAAAYTYVSNLGSGTRGFQLRTASTPTGATTNANRPLLTTNGFIVSGTTSTETNDNARTYHYYAIG